MTDDRSKYCPKHIRRHIDEIARRYIDGAELKELGESYHVHWATLVKHLSHLLSPEFRAVVAGQHIGLRAKLPRRHHAKGFSNSTTYKEGQMRGHAARAWVPVGTVKMRSRTTKFGVRKPWYRVIKVRDEPYASDGNWQALAAYRWEQAHGKLPEGWRVVHKNGKRMQDDLSNLRAMPRREAIRHAQKLHPKASATRTPP